MTPELEAAFWREWEGERKGLFALMKCSVSLDDATMIARSMFQAGVLIGMQDALGAMRQTFLKEGDADG